MKQLAAAGCGVWLFLVSGCSYIPFLGGPSQPPKEAGASETVNQPLEIEKFVKKGQIVDARRLGQSVNIAVVPFTAGVSVAANEELDRISLMIVKGIADIFGDGRHGRFNILTAENAQDADLVIQGRITEVKGSAKIKRWMLLKERKMLTVQGKMSDPQTGEIVVAFSDQADTREEDYKDLGYRVGKNIGLFILSGIQ